LSDVLEVNGLVVEYGSKGKTFVAVDDVSLAVSEGEILGLVGESGAGKSTVTSAVTQLIEPPGRICQGSVRLDGRELLALNDSEMCRVRATTIGSVFQEPLTALSPVMSIGKQLGRCILLSEGTARKPHIAERSVELLDSAGIPDAEKRLEQYPHQLSGGMRQRVVIAMALAGNPRLIIADEPTTALDVAIQHDILSLLQDLCVQNKLAVILITHDMAVVRQVANRTIVMRYGKIVEEGETLEVINRPQHEYTRALISAVPRTDKRLDRFEQIEANGSSSPEKFSDAAIDDWPDAIPVDGPVVELRNICKRYVLQKSLCRKNTRYVEALKNVSLTVDKGTTFGLVGESGSGKSTIAKILCGLDNADSGKLIYKGVNISDQPNSESVQLHCSDIQMVFQDPYSSLNPRHRIMDILSEPLRVHRDFSDAEIRSRVAGVLKRVKLTIDDAQKFPHQFSGGQRQRICIARALLMQPSLLICDEPTSSLDVAIQAEILNLLRDIQDELGLTVLFISHDLAVVRQMCDQIAVLNHGVLCENSEADSLFSSPKHPYTNQLIQKMPKFSTTFQASGLSA